MEFKLNGLMKSLAFINSNQLVVASQGGFLGVFELESSSFIKQYDNIEALMSLSMAPDGKLAVTLSAAGDVIVWDAQTWTQHTMITLYLDICCLLC